MLKPSGGVLKKAFGGAAGGAINAGGAGGAAGKVLAMKKKPTPAVAEGAAKPASVLAGKLNRPKPPTAGKRAGGGGFMGKVGKAFGV